MNVDVIPSVAVVDDVLAGFDEDVDDGAATDVVSTAFVLLVAIVVVAVVALVVAVVADVVASLRTLQVQSPGVQLGRHAAHHWLCS